MENKKHKNVALLRLITTADSSIFLWPVVILFYYKVAGSAAGAGLLLSARALTSALAELPLGIFSDRYGRARTTQAASFLYLVSAVLTALSWSVGFRLLLIAVILQGIAEACESGNHDSLLYESSSSEKDYKKTSALFSTISSTASMISAVIGGVMGAKSLFIVSVISIAPRIVSLIASLYLRDIVSTNGSDAETIRQSMHRLRVLLVTDLQVRFAITGRIIAEGFGEVSWQFRALFVQTVWPAWAIGLSMPLSHGANAIGGVLFAKFQYRIERYKKMQIVLVTTIFGRSILTIAYAMQNVFSPFLISATGIAGPANRTSFSGFLHSKLHDSVRASGFSVLGLATTALFSIVSVGFGAVIDSIGVRWTLVLSSLCALVSTIFYKLALRVPGRD